MEHMSEIDILERHFDNARKLQSQLKRTRVEVRDAMDILGYKSTSATLYELKKLVELELLEYEPPKDGHKKGEYFLP